MKIREKMWLNGKIICWWKKEVMKPGEKLNGRERLFERSNSVAYPTREAAEIAIRYQAEKNGYHQSPTSQQTWMKEYEL